MHCLYISMEYEPPLLEQFNSLFQNKKKTIDNNIVDGDDQKLFMFEECELPLIDLSRLIKNPENDDDQEREKCEKEIVDASSTWGFFQVTNHGIPKEVLKGMELEAKKVFQQPFKNKVRANFLNLPADSYRWGNPSANCVRQIIWSEAFQIPLVDLSRMKDCDGNNLRPTIEIATTKMASLAERLTKILTENLVVKSSFFQENFSPSTSFIRLNRYPSCPVPPEILFGLLPHTDSDFLTVLHQDDVGGLQLVKDGTWYSVKPRQDALVINIGDLFQAWSNGVYKSVNHRVMASGEVERFSVAYFMCPSQDIVIESPIKPSIYKKFSFRDYKDQIRDDILTTGDKIGLSRFLQL